MASSDVIRFAGDININEIKITSLNGKFIDITGIVIGIEIFEDLFSPFISGNLIVNESVDLVSYLPLVGEEFLYLDIATPSFSGRDKVIKGEFYLYKLSDRELMGDRNLAYRLHFVSKESVVDINKKISKCFSGRISDIARTLISDKIDGLETDLPVNIQETSNSTKYVSNYWSPVKNLNYISNSALNQRKDSSFIFFQNRQGFNFVSLEQLYYEPVKQTFIYDSYFRDMALNGKDRKNVPELYKRIKDIKISELYNNMDKNMSGMYKSRIFTHDILTKKYASKNYDMLENWFNRNHLNQYPLASNNNFHSPWSRILTVPKYYNNFENYGDVSNAKTIQKRISEVLQADGNKIQITVPGRTDYTVGIKVNVILYKVEPTLKSDADPIDRILSGNYLVTAINHSITREDHQCIMELVKDSYAVNLNGAK